jgi:hypothetical protein
MHSNHCLSELLDEATFLQQPLLEVPTLLCFLSYVTREIRFLRLQLQPLVDRPRYSRTRPSVG